MKKILLLLVIFLGACAQKRPTAPPEPLYLFFVPQTTAQWRKEMQKGFESAAKQFNLRWQVIEYSSEANLYSAVAERPAVHEAPITIVFTSKQPIRKVALQLKSSKDTLMTLGADDAEAGRIAHSGEDSNNLTSTLSIRIKQMPKLPKNVLMIMGDVPVKKQIIAAELFSISEKWKRFKSKTVDLREVNPEDLKAADLVIPFGEDAVRYCVSRNVPAMLPVDGSEFTLFLLKNKTVQEVIAPDYFQVGYRAGRLAREYYIQRVLANPIVLMPYKEIVNETVDWYVKKRYDLPPAITE